MIIVGIDPGLDGALAYISENGLHEVTDIPSVKVNSTGRGNRKLDGYGLAASIRESLRRLDGIEHSVHVLIEDVHAMPFGKSGSGANTSLMHSKGMIEGVIATLGYPVKFISAQAWKKFYGLKADKSEAINVARTLYGNAPLTLQKHHNRAEAILIARFGLRKLY
jgi:hypothetical protein